jgi:hypothetical protein
VLSGEAPDVPRIGGIPWKGFVHEPSDAPSVDSLCLQTLVHCWGGGGRTGLVQAAWLARSNGLSAADAAAAVVAHAKELGVPRRVDVAALEEFLAAAGSK